MDISQIVEIFGINLLITFGSYGTDRFRPDSDIDVGYESTHKLTLDEEMQLLNDLILYFNRDRLDLVNLRTAVPLLLYEIACNAKLLYEEKENYLRFKLRASARYADTAFLRVARHTYLQEQLKEL